jgi:hypothetical protein
VRVSRNRLIMSSRKRRLGTAGEWRKYEGRVVATASPIGDRYPSHPGLLESKRKSVSVSCGTVPCSVGLEALQEFCCQSFGTLS